jgi:hypothetical protein
MAIQHEHNLILAQQAREHQTMEQTYGNELPDGPIELSDTPWGVVSPNQRLGPFRMKHRKSAKRKSPRKSSKRKSVKRKSVGKNTKRKSVRKSSIRKSKRV